MFAGVFAGVPLLCGSICGTFCGTICGSSVGREEMERGPNEAFFLMEKTLRNADACIKRNSKMNIKLSPKDVFMAQKNVSINAFRRLGLG